MNTNFKRNIKIGYAYNFFLQLNITSAIWVLYLAFKGMSLTEIGILESIYHITGLLFELPTGAIADLHGRKFCVVLGRAVNLLSCILMITSDSFMGFAVSFILSSAAMNLNSGAAEALIFDSLKELGEEDRYKKIWGQLAFVMSMSQGTAVLLGGILADIRFLYAYVFGTFVQMLALIVAFNFSEPTIHKPDLDKHKENHSGKILMDQLTLSIQALKGRKTVMYAILFSALTGSLQTTVFFYSQKYFSDMGFTKTIIAVICAFGSFIEAISSKYAYSLEKKVRLKGTLICICALSILSLAGLALWSKYSVLFYILTTVSGGFAYTIMSDYINSRIPSAYRATILSFDSFSFSLFMIFLFPLFGFMAQNTGFETTFGATALICIPLMIFLTNRLTWHDNEDVKGEKLLDKQDESIAARQIL